MNILQAKALGFTPRLLRAMADETDKMCRKADQKGDTHSGIVYHSRAFHYRQIANELERGTKS